MIVMAKEADSLEAIGSFEIIQISCFGAWLFNAFRISHTHDPHLAPLHAVLTTTVTCGMVGDGASIQVVI